MRAHRGNIIWQIMIRTVTRPGLINYSLLHQAPTTLGRYRKILVFLQLRTLINDHDLDA